VTNDSYGVSENSSSTLAAFYPKNSIRQVFFGKFFKNPPNFANPEGKFDHFAPFSVLDSRKL